MDIKSSHTVFEQSDSKLDSSSDEKLDLLVCNWFSCVCVLGFLPQCINIKEHAGKQHVFLKTRPSSGRFFLLRLSVTADVVVTVCLQRL